MDGDIPKIDEGYYQQGLQAFAAGVSVRQVVEMVQNQAVEVAQSISFAIGFIDGILNKIRE